MLCRPCSSYQINPLHSMKRNSTIGIQVSNADFRWTDDIEKERYARLVNINLGANKGDLISIIGPVASGKTTLLYGLLGIVTHACYLLLV
jgi:energy-coupling factor transporter ATP-binding protein EcfA2